MEEPDIKKCRLSNVIVDDVIDLVIPYITELKDRDTASLVCRRWFKVDSETREHVTMALCYTATPDRLSHRFPNLRSLKLKGIPGAAMIILIEENWGGYVTPWVNEIAISLRQLKSIHFRRMIVSDLDLDVLARARLDELESLKLDKCSGFSTNGLLSIVKHYRKLKTLSMEESTVLEKDGNWIHELALHNTSLEVLNFYMTEFAKISPKDIETIARNCQKLVSVKVSELELLELVGFFKAAVNLEEFCGGALDQDYEKPEKYMNLSFPPKLSSISLFYMGANEMPILFPFAQQIRKLDLLYAFLDCEDHCILLQKCPNLEVLETRSSIGDRGLEVLEEYCIKLKRLRIEQSSDVQEMVDEESKISREGLNIVALGCQRLEYMAVYVSDITNKTLENIGTYLKNLSDFRLVLLNKEEETTDFPLDEGVRSLLIGCKNLRRFAFCVRQGDLTDVGLSYIGKYSLNVRWMLLGYVGESDEGLKEFSNGCKNLQKLEMRGCCFSEKAIAAAVMKLPSLRYLLVEDKESMSGSDLMEMARPYWNIELIPSRKIAEVNQLGEVREMESRAHILAYSSLAGQRTDCPPTVRVLKGDATLI